MASYTSNFATFVTRATVGLSTCPYIWVTRSLTISFLISGDNFFSLMANIILGFHFFGIENSFLTATVDDRLSEDTDMVSELEVGIGKAD